MKHHQRHCLFSLGRVREQVEQLATLHNADEIMAVTNMYYFEDRKRSFQLLKEALA